MRVTIGEVAREALHIETARLGTADQRRIELCWGSSSDGDGSDPRFGAENLTDSWCYSTDRNAAQACGYTREQCLDISQARRGGLCTRTR